MENAYHINAGGHLFEFTENDIAKFDVLKTGESQYHLIHHEMSCIGKITTPETGVKRYIVQIYGEKIEVKINTTLDSIIEKMGYGKAGTTQQKLIKAPMPGLVLEVTVSEGANVKAGDKLLILEAMKMENVLQAATDGIVKKVHIKKGEAVEKSHLLIEMV